MYEILFYLSGTKRQNHDDNDDDEGGFLEDLWSKTSCGGCWDKFPIYIFSFCLEIALMDLDKGKLVEFFFFVEVSRIFAKFIRVCLPLCSEFIMLLLQNHIILHLNFSWYFILMGRSKDKPWTSIYVWIFLVNFWGFFLIFLLQI